MTRRPPPPRRRWTTTEPADPIACVDYLRHRSSHHYGPKGWECSVCAEITPPIERPAQAGEKEATS